MQRHRGLILGVQSAATAGAWCWARPVAACSLDFGARREFRGHGRPGHGVRRGYWALVPETLSLATKTDEPSSSSSSLLREPAQRTCLALNAVLHANYAAILAIMPLRCADVWVTAGPLEIGALFSAVSAVGVFGGPLAGKMSDRHGRAPVVCAGLGLAALGGGGLALADAVAPTAAFFAWGFGVSVAGPAYAATTRAASTGRSARCRGARRRRDCVAPVALGLWRTSRARRRRPSPCARWRRRAAVGFLGTRAGDLPRPVEVWLRVLVVLGYVQIGVLAEIRRGELVQFAVAVELEVGLFCRGE